MTRDTSEREPFAGKRTPELVKQNAATQVQESLEDMFRIARNPLSYVHPAVIPVLLKYNPWLAMFT